MLFYVLSPRTENKISQTNRIYYKRERVPCEDYQKGTETWTKCIVCDWSEKFPKNSLTTDKQNCELSHNTLFRKSVAGLITFFLQCSSICFANVLLILRSYKEIVKIWFYLQVRRKIFQKFTYAYFRKFPNRICFVQLPFKSTSTRCNCFRQMTGIQSQQLPHIFGLSP